MPGAPRRLRCEYLIDPIGIEASAPRLGWWLDDSRPAELQTAYEILAASRLDLLAMDEGDLWASGVVESQQCAHVVYRGKRLFPGRKVFWKVRSYDSDGLPSPWSEPARFEAGLKHDEWRGRWIAAPLQGSRATPAPVPVLRRVFELAAAPGSARLYLAALGTYHAELNGSAVSTQSLAPGWCGFDSVLETQCYDVTGLLQPGANCLAVLLADGWHAGAIGLGARQCFGRQAALKAQLHVELASGGTLVLISDEQWQWRPSWILHAEPAGGESADWSHFDAGWSQPGGAADWYAVQCPAIAEPKLTGLVTELTEPGEALELQERQGPGRSRIFSLAAPVLGRACVRTSLGEGGLLRIRYGLGLDVGGQLEDIVGEDLHSAGQDPEQALGASFSQHGFQHVELSGDLAGTASLSVSACSVRRPVEPAAQFLCDHATLNGLFERLMGTLLQTRQSVPLAGLALEDRVPELRANGLRSKTVPLALGDGAGSGRWLRQLCSAQLEDGSFPRLVPAPPALDEALVDAGAGASDALVECAWQQFQVLGDRRALEQCYPHVKRFLGGLAERHADHLRGDEDAELLATAAYYRSVRTAARMAGVLGHLGDLEDFEMLGGAVRKAFGRRFITPDGLVAGDDLRSYLTVLSHGLLDADERARAAERFLRHLERNLAERRLEATLEPEILRTLTRLGRADLALKLLMDWAEHEVAPERLLDVGALDWLLTGLAGVDCSRDLSEASNAFRRVRIQPRPPIGGLPDSEPLSAGPPLRHVEAMLATINGPYELSWSISEEAFELSVQVPANCSADIILPDDTLHEVVAGRHEFSMAFHRPGDGIPVLREVSTGGG